MRLLRVLLLALFGVFAVVAGLVTAAAVSVATALIVYVRRVLRQPARARVPGNRRQRFARPNRGEVIDITATEVRATEVPADSTAR